MLLVKTKSFAKILFRGCIEKHKMRITNLISRLKNVHKEIFKKSRPDDEENSSLELIKCSMLYHTKAPKVLPLKIRKKIFNLFLQVS